MTASILLLLLIDDKIFEIQGEVKEDKKIREEVGEGWLNPVL